MNRVPVEQLNEQVDRERRRIKHHEEQIRNPTHGFTGQAAQDAEGWHRRMIAGAENRLKQIEERLQINLAHTGRAKRTTGAQHYGTR